MMTVQGTRTLAILLHGNQKYGDEPYYVHLDEVADIAKPYGEVAQILSYLHDLNEDRNVAIEDISIMFDPFIATCVFYLSDEKGPNRRERKKLTYNKLSRMMSRFNIAKIVKVCDRLANVRRGGKNDMYKQEHNDFKAATYVNGLCDELWEEIENILGVAV
jgi:(p)ppGpp synthase/HD superfamily hydrolase